MRINAIRLFVATIALAGAASVASAQSTMVIIVRHGEKLAQPANDPPLSPEGEARARALNEALANVQVGAVISTPFARTMSTVKPVADRLGLTIETVPVAGGVPAHARAIADAVRKHEGKVVLVAGHSNTITAIAAALGAPAMPDLCDGDYDQIFTLQLMPEGAPRFLRARFGAPASDPACRTMR